jgi:hypothetical protein
VARSESGRPKWFKKVIASLFYLKKISSRYCHSADNPKNPVSILGIQEIAMELSDYARKLEELDHLMNDPEAPFEPARLWRLLAELSRHDLKPRDAKRA